MLFLLVTFTIVTIIVKCKHSKKRGHQRIQQNSPESSSQSPAININIENNNHITLPETHVIRANSIASNETEQLDLTVGSPKYGVGLPEHPRPTEVRDKEVSECKTPTHTNMQDEDETTTNNLASEEHPNAGTGSARRERLSEERSIAESEGAASTATENSQSEAYS